MPAKNPRISAVVDSGLLKWLQTKAGREGISVSLVVRDILMRMRTEEEEQYWATAGEERLRNFKPSEALDHNEVWNSR